MAREDSFLRSSLRGSRKLQALEQSPPATPRPPPPTAAAAAAAAAAGVVNAAYELDDLGQQRLHQVPPAHRFSSQTSHWFQAVHADQSAITQRPMIDS